MPTYKTTFFFEGANFGWSETHYQTRDTIIEAQNRAINFSFLRIGLLGQNAAPLHNFEPRMTAIRVSDIEIERDALLHPISPATGRNNNAIGTADNPNLGIQIRAEATALYRRTIQIRGQPDVLCSNMVYAPDPLWIGAFNQYALHATNNGFGILATTKPAAPGGIFSITRDFEAGTITVTTTAAHALVVNDSVRIVKAPGTDLRGNFTVIGIDLGNQFTIRGEFNGVYRGGGQWYKRVQALRNYTNLAIMGVKRYPTGGPFDRPRGRPARRRA